MYYIIYESWYFIRGLEWRPLPLPPPPLPPPPLPPISATHALLTSPTWDCAGTGLNSDGSPGAAPDHDQDLQARPWRPSRPPQPAAGPVGTAAGAWGRGGHRPPTADHAWPAGPIITILYSCNRAALSAVQGRALGRRS